jgi:hypothetical protein
MNLTLLRFVRQCAVDTGPAPIVDSTLQAFYTEVASNATWTMISAADAIGVQFRGNLD